MQTTFTIKEALAYGWHKFRDNWRFLVLLCLALFIVASAASYDKSDNMFLGLLGVIVNLFTMFTLVRIAFMIDAGKKPAVKDVFELKWPMFWRYVLASLMFTAFYVAGLVALIVPGVILIVRLGLFGFPLVEEDMNPWEAIKRSWALTRGHFWKLLGFSIVLGLINIVGALALGLGMLVTAPLCLLAAVHVYQRLKALPAIVPEPHPAAEAKA